MHSFEPLVVVETNKSKKKYIPKFSISTWLIIFLGILIFGYIFYNFAVYVSSSEVEEQADYVLNNRDPENYWPFEDDDDGRNSASMKNDSLPNIEDLLPKNISLCRGMGFICADNSNRVIGINARCDGVPNCADGSDEINCIDCKTSFSCPIKASPYKKCLRSIHLCDRVFDCDDNTDEELCNRYSCPPETFKCQPFESYHYHNRNMCLPKSFVCDGESHCEKSEDEANCDGHCNNGAMWCEATKSCIPAWKKCNGVINCPNAIDESNCTCHECAGKKNALCKNGENNNHGFCVKLDRICNDQVDCPRGADESGCPAKNSTLFGVLQYSIKYA